MALSRTTFVYDGAQGNIAKCTVQGVLTNVAAGVLKTFCEAHSLAKINVVSFATRTVTDVAPDAVSNTDERMIVYLQDIATGNTVSFTIASPLGTDFEAVPGREGGWRTTDTFNGLLKAALETATGRTFRVLYGIVITKK